MQAAQDDQQNKKRKKDSESDSSQISRDSDTGRETASSESRSKKRKKKRKISPSRRKGKKRRKQKADKKRKNKSDDSENGSGSGSSASGSEESSEELSRSASRHDDGFASKITKVAAKHPGRLLKKTVQTMYSALHPGEATTGVPPVLNQFLQQAMIAHGQLEGRNLRELQTTALAGDAIFQGKLEEGMEILLQRWKRVESVATEFLPGEHLELLPPTRPTTLSLEEREECSELSRIWLAYDEKNWHRGQSPS